MVLALLRTVIAETEARAARKAKDGTQRTGEGPTPGLAAMARATRGSQPPKQEAERDKCDMSTTNRNDSTKNVSSFVTLNPNEALQRKR